MYYKMYYKLLNSSVLVTAALTFSLSSFANDNEQKKLDAACESARDIALAPHRKEIYNECREKTDKDKLTCKSDAQAYNGNRINGAPMFYELPACVKAFDYRNKNRK